MLPRASKRTSSVHDSDKSCCGELCKFGQGVNVDCVTERRVDDGLAKRRGGVLIRGGEQQAEHVGCQWGAWSLDERWARSGMDKLLDGARAFY